MLLFLLHMTEKTGSFWKGVLKGDLEGEEACSVSSDNMLNVFEQHNAPHKSQETYVLTHKGRNNIQISTTWTEIKFVSKKLDTKQPIA